jgi:hypothetical protein
MFCRKCGHQLNDDARFCPSCGARTDVLGGTNAAENTAGYNADGSEKINWRALLTKDNIERFAPIAALVPIAMAVVTVVLGGILFSTLGLFSLGYVICKILITLIKLLFIVASAGATFGLVYVAVNFKDVSKVSTWVAPFATLLATLSCLGIAFGWGIFAWITGIISVVMGLELVSRIVIAQQPMDSPVNPGAAFATYKQYYSDYKAKYPSTKDLERDGIVDPENSKFDGSGLELLGYIILTLIVGTVTCGIAAPWMICKIYRWKVGHTVINGKRLTFTGSGGSLLGHWILWEILSIITCGIYGFFVYVALRKWEMSHTYIEGEPIVANGNESYFDGGSLEYLGYGLISCLLLVITCGLAFPWVMSILQGWDTKHQVINNRRLVFSGSGLGFLGEYLIIFILSVITCGIYTSWGIVRLNKYIVMHTDFEA